MVMARIPHNEAILEQLKCEIAHFELVSSPVRSISASNSLTCPAPFSIDCGRRFFARIGPSLGNGSPALDKVERHLVHKITGDGRCLFRALVFSDSCTMPLCCLILKNRNPTPADEIRSREWLSTADLLLALGKRETRQTDMVYSELLVYFINEDDLRMAVKEVLCDNEKERHQYEEAIIAITVEEPLKRYCQRIQRPDFWGGESELLVLSKLCKQQIVVYIPEHEHRKSGWSGGFIPIAEYGAEFCKNSRNEKQKKVVRLLYSGKNHYDLLV